MSDIVRRLRVETDRLCSEAADEIERLLRELDVEKAMVAFHQKNEQVKNAEIERPHEQVWQLEMKNAAVCFEGARLRALVEAKALPFDIE